MVLGAIRVARMDRFAYNPNMENHIYKTIELTGTSPNSIEEAVSRSIAKAGQSIENLRWFTIKEVRGHIADNTVKEWQVTTKVSFTIKD